MNKEQTLAKTRKYMCIHNYINIGNGMLKCTKCNRKIRENKIGDINGK